MDSMNNKRILETLKLQPLSDEEKTKRHILGRLYGPIATSKESTRNGRLYNAELWEKALNDNVFKEKVANKSLFLELGHPTDREEIDMKCVCACIPEMPKIVDGDLYAYVDILDTANGRLLKTLCDYGFVPGISSRGSGDVMSNNEVDPDTFFLQTWDIVDLPAVQKARLSIVESYSTKSLHTVLSESYKKADNEDKQIMVEALNKLNISEELLDDTADEVVASEVEIVDDPEEYNLKQLDSRELIVENDAAEEVVEPEVNEIEVNEDEEVKSEDESENEEEKSDESDENKLPETIKDLLNNLKDYDGDKNLEFKSIVIGDKEYSISCLEFEDEDDKVEVKICCASDEDEDISDKEEIESKEVEPEAEDNAEEVVDDKSEEIMESLKEIVRQKDLLESQVKVLNSQQAARDSEVRLLNEELAKYKTSYEKAIKLVSGTNELVSQVESLTEQLNNTKKELAAKDTEFEVEKSTLTESISRNVNDQFDKRVNEIKEKYTAKTKQIVDDANAKLKANVEKCNSKINESIELAKKYKAKADNTMAEYIKYRASMLGVDSSAITNKLSENYTVENVNAVCESILTSARPSMSFNLNKDYKVKITESKNKNTPADDGYDDLLELAGLK